MPSTTLDSTLRQLLIDQEEPQIVAIKGSWGTGKTYFWKRFAENNAEHKSSYVSLFGLASTDELRQALAASLIPSGGSDAKRRVQSILGKLPQWSARGIGLSAELLTEVFLERALRQTGTVCLDDMERTSIDRADLLGFANNLRDEYRVNVVMIYNEDQLADDDPYYHYREKVIDRELPFLPDINEVVEIANPDPAIRDDVQRHCTALGLTNIRVIRRALQYFTEIDALLPDGAPNTMAPQALHSLLLFSYSRFTPQSVVGSLRALAGYSELGEEMRLYAKREAGGGGQDQDNAKDEQDRRARVDLLNRYGYRASDIFDQALIEFVENGIPDIAALEKAIEEHTQGKGKREKEEKLQEVWNLFNHSFQSDEQAFVDALLAAAKEQMQLISLKDMDNFLWVLGRLGRKEEQGRILKQYVAAHVDRVRQWEEADDFSMVQHVMLRDAIAKLRADVSDSRSLEDIMAVLLGADSWSSRDVARLNQFTADDFEEYFTSREGPPLGNHAKALARFAKRFANPDQEMIEIEQKAIEALKRVATRSEFNKAKIERYVDFEA